MAESSASDVVVVAPIGALGIWRRKRPERSLVRAARRGAPDAAEELARRHWGEAVHAAYLIVRDPGTAEDVAQESIVAALRNLNSFDGTRAFRPWLHRIVVNRAIDAVRARDRRRETGLEAAEIASCGSAPGSDALRIQEMLTTLDPETRAIVVLRYLLDYRSQEVAGILGLSASAVRTRLHRAMAQLRQELDGEEDR
jgi:RNA polymerase sigma-70 factor (ECF subfamily)